MDYVSSQASADVGNASINYVRNGQHVAIRINGKIDEIHVPTARTVDAVQTACERELDQMRRTFQGLYDRLAPQLGATGDAAKIRQGKVDWDESRDWRIGSDRSLTIASSKYETISRVTLANNDVADTAVAKQAIINEINNRETAIRAVYRQIAEDLQVQRKQ